MPPRWRCSGAAHPAQPTLGGCRPGPQWQQGQCPPPQPLLLAAGLQLLLRVGKARPAGWGMGSERLSPHPHPRMPGPLAWQVATSQKKTKGLEGPLTLRLPQGYPSPGRHSQVGFRVSSGHPCLPCPHSPAHRVLVSHPVPLLLLPNAGTTKPGRNAVRVARTIVLLISSLTTWLLEQRPCWVWEIPGGRWPGLCP